MIKIILNWIKKRYALYELSDLQTIGNCGLCGKVITNTILLKNFPFGICKKCIGEHFK